MQVKKQQLELYLEQRIGSKLGKEYIEAFIVTQSQTSDFLECEVKWALASMSANKSSGGDGISAELFQILKDDAVKVLHSICQQI